MKYTALPAARRSSPAVLAIAPASLYTAFAQLPDPRRKQGTRYALAAVLTLAVAAILSNHRSVLAIAEWGAAQSAAIKQALGFPGGSTPHQTTIQRLFRQLDPAPLATVLTRFFDPDGPGELRARGSQGIAIDGKAQRGRLQHTDEPTHPVHAVSAFCHDVGLVLAQMVVDSQQHEAELSVAPGLLSQLEWQGRVLTGDALFCQRHICTQVIEAGGDYLFLVKANQPRLQDDIALLFSPPTPAELAREGSAAPTPLEERYARTVDTGHGRLEVREIRVSSELADYSDWPYLAQVFELTRTWEQQAKTRREVHLGVTSLPQSVASPKRLLALKREHWGIENRLHYVKDVTLGEDASHIRCGQGPQVMAILRNTAITILHRAGHQRIAAQLRYNSVHPEAALALLGIPLP